MPIWTQWSSFVSERKDETYLNRHIRCQQHHVRKAETSVFSSYLINDTEINSNKGGQVIIKLRDYFCVFVCFVLKSYILLNSYLKKNSYQRNLNEKQATWSTCSNSLWVTIGRSSYFNCPMSRRQRKQQTTPIFLPHSIQIPQSFEQDLHLFP